MTYPWKRRLSILPAVLALIVAPLEPQAPSIAKSRTIAQQAAQLSPQELFSKVSRSVVVVEAQDLQGSVVAFGSGVVVAPGEVVTNRHVIAGGVRLVVRQADMTWPTVVTHFDVDHDLCILGVEGLKASPVVMRKSSSLSIGERVYAVGAPEGFELTLSEGLISGLRSKEGSRLVQTTAPFSRGSSGGGLFDVKGRLVGITTFFLREGQNLNFALPIEWVSDLDSSPPSNGPSASTETPAQQALISVQLGEAARQAHDYPKAIKAYQEAIRLQPTNPDAHRFLGDVLTSTGDLEGALNELNEALRLNPTDAYVHYGIARVHVSRGESPSAISELSMALTLNPDESLLPLLHSGLCQVLVQKGDRKGAIPECREALRLNTADGLARYNLSLALYLSGDIDFGAQEYQALRILDAGLGVDLLNRIQDEKGNVGIVAGGFEWASSCAFKSHSNDNIEDYSVSLQNVLRSQVRGVRLQVLFLDNANNPIHVEEIFETGGIPAGLSKRRMSSVDHSVKALTACNSLLDIPVPGRGSESDKIMAKILILTDKSLADRRTVVKIRILEFTVGQ